MRQFRDKFGYKRPGVIAYVALFALALFQLGFAAHENDHIAADLADSCAACSVYDQFDDAPVTVTLTCPISLTLEADSFTPRRHVSGRRTYGTQSRAPPAA